MKINAKINGNKGCSLNIRMKRDMVKWNVLRSKILKQV